MRVAIVGAGVSGLVSARVLRAVGLDVVVFESRSDVGGVWSASRRYPGLCTQNDKHTYTFSDMPMRAEVPEYPEAADVQRYLGDYVRHHGLDEVIELDTRVTAAEPLPDRSGWTLRVEGPAGGRAERFDWLVISSGIYSLPHVPDFPGREEFETAGGRVLPASSLGDGEVFDGRDLVVVGWGKSAADIATAACGRARTVTVVARRITWKLPRWIGRLSWQRLVLSRAGEYAIWAPRRRHLVVRLMLKALALLRRRALHRLERTISEQQQLERRALVPDTGINTFTHLATAGFFEAIDDGTIDLRPACDVVGLGSDDGRPCAHLSDGSVVPADVLVAATGFDQDLSIFGEQAQAGLLDGDGDLLLYRHTLPERAPRLAFVGWYTSFRSPIGAELQALWVAALIHGLVRLPGPGERRHRTSVYRLQHRRAEERGVPLTVGATQTLPDLDSWLAEAGLRVPVRVRARELVSPLDPASYRGLLPQLQRRVRDQELSRRRAERANESSAEGAREDSPTR